MLNTDVETLCWNFEKKELSDPDLIDKLTLSVCDTNGITCPDFKLSLLISELVTNAIDHGVLGLDSRLKKCDAGFRDYFSERVKRLDSIVAGWISVTAEWVDDSTLRISVEDSGAGFDYEKAVEKLTDNEQLHGRGLAIIQSLCKSVVHIGCGNCVVVDFEVVNASSAVSAGQ